MKLAEALKLREGLNSETSRIDSKIRQSLILQEGKTPLYNVDKKYDEFVAKTTELYRLAMSTNYTNNTVEIKDGTLCLTKAKTIGEVLIHRKFLKKKLELLEKIVEKGQEKDLESIDEIRFKSFVDIEVYDTKAEDVRKQIQELDTKLQELTWEIDLIEI